MTIKGLLIDLNGTLHVGKELTPRAAQAIDRLRRAKIPFVFCSNNTKESEPRLLKKLSGMGLPAQQDELITSLGACRALCEKRGLRPYLLLSPEAAEEFASIPTTPPYDAVVVGLHPPSFAYGPLNTAFRVLAREPLHDAPPADKKPVLIAPHTAAYLQAPADEEFPAGLSLGIGAYVAALETAADTKAEVVGKPTRAFFELALERLRAQRPVETNEVAIVGDDVKNDLGEGAKELGLRRILVKTGKYRSGDEERAQPDEVHDTFADFVDALLEELLAEQLCSVHAAKPRASAVHEASHVAESGRFGSGRERLNQNAKTRLGEMNAAASENL